MELSKSLSKAFERLEFKHFQMFRLQLIKAEDQTTGTDDTSGTTQFIQLKIVFKCKENVSIFELAQNYSERHCLGKADKE